MSDTTPAGSTAAAIYQGLLEPVPTVREGDAPVTSLSFVAEVTVNGEPVPIKSGNLLDLAASGIEFSFPKDKELPLGDLQDLVNWLCVQMGLTAPDWNTLPEMLKKITTVKAIIKTLVIKAKPTQVLFDIVVTLEFNWQIIGSLVLKTFTFQLVRDQAPLPPPPNS